MSESHMPDPLRVLAVCGVGMGTSLLLRMTAESVLQSMGIEATVENTDVSSAHSMEADVILGQEMHTEDFQGAAPVVVAVTDFMDEASLRTSLEAAFHDIGWI